MKVVAKAKAKAKQCDVLSGLKSWAGGDDEPVPAVAEPPLLDKVGKPVMKTPTSQVPRFAQLLHLSNICVDTQQISQSYTLVLYWFQVSCTRVQVRSCM